MAVNVGDAAALGRLVEYLSTGDYHDAVPEDEEPGPKEQDELDQMSTSPQLFPQDQNASQDDTSAINEKLIANANVSLLADYFQVPDLEQLAVTKFRAGLQGFKAQGFADVIALVYGSEVLRLAQKLKDVVDSAIVQHAKALLGEEDFKQECQKQSIVTTELFSRAVDHYELKLTEPRDNHISHVDALEGRRKRAQGNCLSYLRADQFMWRKQRSLPQCRYCNTDITPLTSSSIFGFL